ncbi:MAG: hypothetical protein MUO76_07950, partial [Anaerolineaceae bacterium]|nr:hypothetical protein [Anaerolineaceae bacterium]
STLAGLFGGLVAAFGMGTRWLLLLLPASIIEAISGQVQMLGSAAQSAPDLQAALISPWVIEGHGPFAFPFAYANGIYSPGIFSHAVAGMVRIILMVLILITFNRWRGWRGWIITMALMSSASLQEEAGMVLLLIAWAVITFVYVIKNRTTRLPDSIWKWWLVLAAVWIFAMFQGGVWTEVIQGWVARVFSGEVQPVYQIISFELVWPVFVSSHLGVLSLTNPLQLIAALLEIGPIILALPLIFIYGYKAFQVGRYYEAGVIVAGALTLGMVVIQFTGSTGVRDTSKLYSFISLGTVWAVPILWMWGEHRSDLVRTLLAVWGTIILFGGIVLFGIELPAAQKPINSTFISELDKQMHQEFWNELEPDALIFDRMSSRGTAVFGRYTDSSLTWWSQKPEWLVLYDRPDPFELQSAGFDYLYVDYIYDFEVNQRYPGLWDETCMQLMREYHHKHTEDFRRLYDLRTCR